MQFLRLWKRQGSDFTPPQNGTPAIPLRCYHLTATVRTEQGGSEARAPGFGAIGAKLQPTQALRSPSAKWGRHPRTWESRDARTKPRVHVSAAQRPEQGANSAERKLRRHCKGQIGVRIRPRPCCRGAGDSVPVPVSSCEVGTTPRTPRVLVRPAMTCVLRGWPPAPPLHFLLADRPACQCGQ